MKAFYRYTAMVLLLVVASVCSFWVPRRNLRGIGQVAGIALDRQGDSIRATFELYVPAVDEPIGQNRQTVTTTGASLEECIQNARLVSGWELFTDDAMVLILGGKDHTFLLPKVLAYYSNFKHDHMDLPVFFAFGQPASKIFEGEGSVISMDLAESGKNTDQLQTVRDLMNNSGKRVLIKGEGAYEIIS